MFRAGHREGIDDTDTIEGAGQAAARRRRRSQVWAAQSGAAVMRKTIVEGSGVVTVTTPGLPSEPPKPSPRPPMPAAPPRDEEPAHRAPGSCGDSLIASGNGSRYHESR